MMEFVKNKDLKDLNTFALPVSTSRYVSIKSVDELRELVMKFDLEDMDHFVLGEGSNTLFTKDFDGLVIDVNIPGIEILDEGNDEVIVKVGAGVNWDQFVHWSVDRDLSGIENLAFIPGSVGAAPIQNIAAYGQQVADVIKHVYIIDLHSGEEESLKKDDCDFRYRYSIFKEPEFKSKIVHSVTFRLSKIAKFDLSYHSRFKNESLQDWLEKEAEEPYKPKDVANAVTALRKYKLPSIKEYGTCGSAFVNPFITNKEYKELAKKVPELQSYPVTRMDYSKKEWDDVDEMDIVKIPAGRLLDELGWKNKWIGNVGTFERHALCVVTNKKADPKELIEYIEKMKKSVINAYGIELKTEIVMV